MQGSFFIDFPGETFRKFFRFLSIYGGISLAEQLFL